MKLQVIADVNTDIALYYSIYNNLSRQIFHIFGIRTRVRSYIRFFNYVTCVDLYKEHTLVDDASS